MKKIIFFCLVGLCSCTQNQNLEEVSDNEIKSVQVSILPSENEIESRLEVTSGLKYLWELNDTIGIFPNKGGQVEFPVESNSVGTSKADFNGGGWALKGGYTYSAYYPFNFYNRNAAKIPFSYEGQILQGKDNRKHLSKYALLISNPTTVANGQLVFSMKHVGCMFQLNLTLPEAKTYTSLDLYADSEIIPVKKYFNILESGAPSENFACSNHLSVGLENVQTTSDNEKVVLWVAFPTMSQPTKTLKVIIKDSEGYVYVGDVSRLNPDKTTGSYDFFLDLKTGGYQLKASPVLSDGVSGSIEDWEIGEEILGSAN